MKARWSLLVATCVAQAAAGQTIPGPSKSAPAGVSATPAIALDGDIVVTAQRRSENLHDVPIAVSAFSAQQLQRSGINDARQLMSIAPSLNLTSTTSDSAGVVIRLRGVGSEAINPGLESSVATFVDGVYRARSNLSLTDIPGIERVEVLRGPQGTLFGKNTSAGLINVVTARPSYTPIAQLAATYGNYDDVELLGAGGGTLVSDLAAWRVDASFQRRDGWLRDLSSGQRYRNRNRYTVRAQALIEPTDAITVRLIGDAGRRRETGPDTYAPKRYDPFYQGLLQRLGYRTALELNDLIITTTPDRASVEETKQWGLSAELTADLGGVKLTSITAYRDWRNVQAREVDYAEADLLYIPFGAAGQALRAFTQEIRFDGRVGAVDWIAGGFYGHEQAFARYGYRYGRDLERFYDAAVAGVTGRPNSSSFYTGLPVGGSYPDGGGVGRQDFRQRGDSFSLFGHATWHVTDRLSLIGGIRGTREDKSVRADLSGTNNPGCAALIARGLATPGATPVSAFQCLQLFDPRYDGRYRANRRENALTGLATVAWELSDTLNAYATWSRGYKGGGFVLDQAGFRPLTIAAPDANQLAFDPEFAKNWEGGVKFRSPGGAVTVNTALFHTRFSDFQLSYNTGAALVTTNIARVTTKGVEIEATARPGGGFQLSGGVTYADARYGPIPARVPPLVQAIAGRRLANAPEWVATGSIGWDATLGRFRVFAYADARYQSAVLTERLLRAGSEQKGYVLANARIGIGAPDQRWTLELWTRNLTDHRFFAASIPATFQGTTLVGSVGEPRMAGITLRNKFAPR